MSRLRNDKDADGVKVTFSDEERRLAAGADKDAHQNKDSHGGDASLGGQGDEDPAMTRGFGAILNEIYSGQSGPGPARDFINEPDPSAQNRNPGDTANTIRDVRPSLTPAEHYTDGLDTVDASAYDADIPGRMHDTDAYVEETMDTGKAQKQSGSHWATALLQRLDNPRSVIALVIIVVILAAMIGLMKSSRNTPEPVSAAVPTLPAARTAVDFPPYSAELEEIRAVQLHITSRQNELEAAVASLQESSDKKWAGYAALLHEIQKDHHMALSAVSKTIDSLRQQLRTQEQQAGPGQTGVQAPDNSQDLVVNLASFTREQPVRDMMARLQGLGIETEQQVVRLDGKTRYRLRVAGFSSEAEAREFAMKLKTEHGIKDAWVGPR